MATLESWQGSSGELQETLISFPLEPVMPCRPKFRPGDGQQEAGEERPPIPRACDAVWLIIQNGGGQQEAEKKSSPQDLGPAMPYHPKVQTGGRQREAGRKKDPKTSCRAINHGPQRYQVSAHTHVCTHVVGEKVRPDLGQSCKISRLQSLRSIPGGSHATAHHAMP